MGNQTSARIGDHISTVKNRVTDTIRRLRQQDTISPQQGGALTAESCVLPDGCSAWDLSDTDIDCVDGLEDFLKLHTEPHSVFGLMLIGNIKVTAVPTNIALFNNLLDLNLSDNYIQEVPWSIIYLKKLRKLDLSYNMLTEIPKYVCFLAGLEILLLQANHLKYLPTELLQLEHLKALDVTDNYCLVSPTLKQCSGGIEAIWEILRVRQGRTNLWHGQRSSPFRPSRNSLMSLCVECIVEHNVEFLSATSVPPVIKKHLRDQVQQSEQTVHVIKCSRCHRFFSNKFNFNMHECIRLGTKVTRH